MSQLIKAYLVGFELSYLSYIMEKGLHAVVTDLNNALLEYRCYLKCLYITRRNLSGLFEPSSTAANALTSNLSPPRVFKLQQ
jgi:hypothetical protein